MDHKLTLVIPAKNESESLPSVLDELSKYDYSISIVLEREDIKTIDAIKDYKCNIIFQKNKGYGDALIEGINSVNTEYFCIFNADGSFNPVELDKMLNKINAESADFVFGTRYENNCGSDDDTIVTYIGNYFFTKIGNIFFNLNLSDILNDKFSKIVRNLQGRAVISESDLDLTLREIRIALLEADVALIVVKDFISSVKNNILGKEILKSIKPDQMIIKLVQDELIKVLGSKKKDKKTITKYIIINLSLEKYNT